MTTVSVDRRARNKPNDGFELLREDVENMIKDDMSDVGNMGIDTEAEPTVAGINGGIVRGFNLSGIGLATLTISAGTAYTTSQKRIDDAQTTVAIGGYADGSYYVDKVISINDDPTTNGTHPFSGDVKAKRKVPVITNRVTAFITSLVGTGHVRIGRIEIASGLIVSIGDYAEDAFAGAETLYLWAKAGGVAPIYGYAGNRRFYRFKLESGTAVAVVETTHPWHTDTHYLDITIPTDSSGNVVATFDDVRTAISSTTYFQGYMTTAGASTFPAAGAWYSSTYIQLSGGTDHRKYKVARLGSDSIRSQDATERERFDFSSDTLHYHVTRKGHADITENNPHGLAAEDIPGLIDDMSNHQKREHNRDRSGIARGSTPTWLLATAAANTVTIAAGDPTYDRAIINGRVVTAATTANTFSDAPGASFNLYLAEFRMSSSGALSMTKIADWVANPGSDILLSGTWSSLLTIKAKSPGLQGTHHLALVVTAGPLAYKATFGTGAGAGPDVYVTTVNTTYRLYNAAGEWIDVYHEDDTATPLVAGTYENDINFVTSDVNSTTLTIATASWANGTLRWGNVTDTRKYGTFSQEHETYGQVADALEYGCRFSGPSLLDNKATPTALIPFEVDYRGQTYRIPQTTLASISGAWANGNNFIAVRFDGTRTPEVVRLGATLTGNWNKITDILLGNVWCAVGSPVTASSHFFRQTSSKGYVGTHIKVDAYGQGWDIDDALEYIHTVCSDATIRANTAFTIELLSDVITAGGGLSYVAGNLTILGNTYSITGDTEIQAQIITADSVTFSTGLRLMQGLTATSSCVLRRVLIGGAHTTPFLDIRSTLGTIEAFQCGFGHTGNVAAFYTQSTTGVINIKDSNWYSVDATANLITTSSGANVTGIRIDGGYFASVGTLFSLGGRSHALEFERMSWVHAAAAPVLSYFGNAGIIYLRMYDNILTWTRTDATATADFMLFADSASPGNLRFSSRIIGNDATFTFDAVTTDAALIRISDDAGVLTLSGLGILFSDNIYRISGRGLDSDKKAFKVLDSSISDDYSSTFEASNEKLVLGSLTHGCTHTAGLVGCTSVRYDGIEFVSEDLSITRYMYLSVDGDAVTISNVTFPVAIVTGGVVAGMAYISGEGYSISASNIFNVAMDDAPATYWVSKGNDSSIQIRNITGRVSDSGGTGDGCLVFVDLANATDTNCAISVAGCSMEDSSDDEGFLAKTIAHSGSGTKAFCVNNCQYGGNPIVSDGFDVSDNYHIAL